MKKLLAILSLFAAAVIAPAHARAEQPTVIVGAGPAEAFNDASPMPESLDWLKSPGALKAHVLVNLVKSGSVELNGNFVLKDGASSFVSVQGDSPAAILSALGNIQWRLSMPDKSQTVRVSSALHDARGGRRASGTGTAAPVLQADGTYSMTASFELEMSEHQPIEIPGVTAATISQDYGTGYVYGEPLPVWNGLVYIPMSALENKGYLMLVRDEPVDGGGTRKVSYGYQIGTGLSVHMIDVKAKAAFSLKNYWEADDVGMPLFIGGKAVPIRLTMAAKVPVPTSEGYVPKNGQPAARLKVTVVGRLTAISIGCYGDQGLIERGHDLRVRNMETGMEYALNPDADGIAFVYLSPGTYGVWYTVDALGVPRG